MMRFSAVLNFLENKNDCVIFLIKNVRECPGSPGVVTLHFHCQGGWLALIPQTVWCGQNKQKKKKSYTTEISLSFCCFMAILFITG